MLGQEVDEYPDLGGEILFLRIYGIYVGRGQRIVIEQDLQLPVAHKGRSIPFRTHHHAMPLQGPGQHGRAIIAGQRATDLDALRLARLGEMPLS